MTDSSNKLHALAMEIANAPAGADIAGMMAGLTADEAKQVAALVSIEADRGEAEYRHHAAWADRERAKGRPESELTWGNCVRETGILSRDGLRAQ